MTARVRSVQKFPILELAYAVAECFMSTGVAASVINMSLAAGLDARETADQREEHRDARACGNKVLHRQAHGL